MMIAKITAIYNPNTMPAKTCRRKAKAENRIIDMTHGHKTRAVIVADSNHVILSAVTVETLQGRLEAMG